MYPQRSAMPRISEIAVSVLESAPGHAIFCDFDNRLQQEFSMMSFFSAIETDLRQLDGNAWNCLKDRAVKAFLHQSEQRKWQAAYDTLNEAKGYRHLLQQGCNDICFIPPSATNGIKTPDLKGWVGNALVLCEVKTINPSETEAEKRHNIAENGGFVPATIQRKLPIPFFNKLESTLCTAYEQLRHCEQDRQPRMIAYLILNPDDWVAESLDDYRQQIRGFMLSKRKPELEVVIDTLHLPFSDGKRLFFANDGSSRLE